MRKRFFLLLMAAVMAIVLIPLSPIAAEDTINYDHDYNNDGTNDSWDVSADGNGSVYAYLTQNDGGSTYTLTVAGTGAMKDYYQYNASSSDGRTAAPWMETYGESITAVDIKDGVTKVGSFAFAMCTKLEEATYPENCVLTRSCFKGTALTEITVYPGNISTEEGVDCSYVFMGDAGTSKLENVTFAEGVTSIPNYYLDWAFNLESLTIPSTVTEIGRGAFRGAGNHTTNGVSVTSHTGSIDWINGYDNYFKSGTQDTDAKVAAISGTIPAVEMTLPVDANFSLFSGISGYSYSSSDTSVVSVSDHTATTQAEGTATVTGSKAGSGSTITYNITVTNELQIISTWDDLMRAFQYGGSYILANSISYDPGVYTHNDNGILNADGVTVEINLGGHTLSTSNITRLFGTSETDGANKGSIALSNGTIKADVPTGDNVDTATLTITRGSDDSFTAENVTFEIGNRQYLVHADNGGTVER